MTSCIPKSVIYDWSNAIKSQKWSFTDNLSIGSHNKLIDLLNQIFQDPCHNHNLVQGQSQSQLLTKPIKSINQLTHFEPGFHFLYNNQQNHILGPDGYDNYQAPVDLSTGSSIFLRRMWVKGDITFNHTQSINAGDLIECEEKVSSVRMVENSVFVTILRDFITTNNDKKLLNESRTLVYTNELYNETPISQSFIDSHVTQSIDLKLSSIDLLKYSMMTYNLHKIHLNKQYTTQIENLSTLIIHGPLLITILLYWFKKVTGKSVVSINYKIIRPVFVADEFSLGFIPLENTNNSYNVVIYSKHHGMKYLDGIVKVE